MSRRQSPDEAMAAVRERHRRRELAYADGVAEIWHIADRAIARVWRICLVQVAALLLTLFAGWFILMDLLVWHISIGSW